MQTLLETQRTRTMLCLLLLTVLVIAVFSAVPRFDFADWDDPLNVSENPYYLPVTAENILHFWRHAYFSLYMPVTYTLWAWCAQSGQISEPLPRPDGGTNLMDPSPFHTMSLLFHAVNTMLVFLLVRFLLGKTTGSESGSPWQDGVAFLGSCLFAIHPLQVEAVAWITGFNNLSAGFFGLCALLTYLPAAVAPNRERFLPRYTLATLFFTLALLSKPTAAAFPLVAFFLEVIVLRGSWRRSLGAMALWIVLTVGEIAITLSASANANQRLFLPLWGRPFIVLDALAFYGAKLFYPLHLGLDYGHPPQFVLRTVGCYLAGLGTLIVFGLLLRLRNKNIAFGLLVMVLATLPMLGVVPYYFQRYSTVADRYLYFGMLGVAFAVASALYQCPERFRRLAIGGVTIIIIVLAGLGYQQASYWHDTTRLFSHVLKVNARSSVAYNNLGTALNRQEKREEANQLFRKALEIRPTDPSPLYNLGTNLGRSGKYTEALQYLQAAAYYDPHNAPTQNNLGLIWEHLGQPEKALAAYRMAQIISPEFAPAKGNELRLSQKMATTPK